MDLAAEVDIRREIADITAISVGDRAPDVWRRLNGLEFELRRRNPELQPTALPPKVSVRARLRVNCSSRPDPFGYMLQYPLPFKIPLLNMRHVIDYPHIFEYGEAEYKSSVDAWIECFGGSVTSEATVVANDFLWQKVLQVLCDLQLILNEYDPSSQVWLRPDFAALRGQTLVMKGEAKCNLMDISSAIKELTGKFHPSARLLFPNDCPEIPGVATSQQGSSLHRIYFAEGAFRENQVKSYQFLTEDGRVEFICDIFKIALWMTAQGGPIEKFHLLPDIRVKTRNKHHITLTKDGLLKEFNHHGDYSKAIAQIKRIYDAQLPNVEQGVTNSTSITITTIGRTVADAIRNFGMSKQTALDGARRAVEQLHGIGMAHCDICVDNLFVHLDTGVVFLGDLEYCRPMDEPAPASLRRSDPRACNAEELDKLQLTRLQDDLARV
eukprot:gene30529-36896_t